MSKAAIDQASAATAVSERAIESAQNLLRRERPRNSYGVYMDRKSVVADIQAALRDIEAAWVALHTFGWPTPTDYEGV